MWNAQSQLIVLINYRSSFSESRSRKKLRISESDASGSSGGAGASGSSVSGSSASESSGGADSKSCTDSGKVSINTQLEWDIKYVEDKVAIPYIVHPRKCGVSILNHRGVIAFDLNSFESQKWSKKSNKCLCLQIQRPFSEDIVPDSDLYNKIVEWTKFFDDVHLFTYKIHNLPEEIIQHDIHILKTYKDSNQTVVDFFDEHNRQKKIKNVELYDRVDVCKLSMVLWAFENKYDYALVIDVFNMFPLSVPTSIWELVQISGLLCTGNEEGLLENWGYYAYKDAVGVVKEGLKNVLDNGILFNNGFYQIYATELSREGTLNTNFWNRFPYKYKLFLEHIKNKK